MRAFYFLMAILGWSTVCAAQLTPEEAYQKLQRKQMADAVAASQPAEHPARPSGEAIGRIIHAGWDALVSRRFADAVALFDKAVGADASDPVALEGRGICKYELKEYKSADQDLQKAYGLSSRGGPARVPRQMVIAAAAASVMNANPMRAAKILQDVMGAMEQNGKLDEGLQDDLGIALSHADGQARKLPLFHVALRFYMEYDKKLGERKHDGTARWGTKWIESKSADENWKIYKEAAENVERATTEYQRAGLAREHAHDNYLEVVGGLRLHTSEETYRYTSEFKESLAAEAAIRKRMEKAIERLKECEKPPFPRRIEHDWQEPR